MADKSEIKGWLTGRVPQDWYAGPPEIDVDDVEILLVGPLRDIDQQDGVDLGAARMGRVKQHREDTRDARMRIANEAEKRFGRPVSWGVKVGDRTYLFTHLAVPVMTRLRMRERAVLDALVDAGVARNRSQALAWCVRLVGEHQSEWIDQLRDAMSRVQEVRDLGPKLN
ncbi:MAG TPA: hypothetical protein VFM93_14270 [Candidatus Limnocylindria bacterium]|nr:hypothetical protein [Candidatus Limnocylindria bacterium]